MTDNPLDKIFYEVNSELTSFRKQLSSALEFSTPLLYEAGNHIIRAGGKHLRPALLFLSAKASSPSPANLVPLAVSIEMMHLASLIHDDIIDRAYARRGRKSINKKWGNDVAVLLGDYFYGKSLFHSYRYGPEVVETISSIINDLVEGEFYQKEHINNTQIEEYQYLTRVEKKAASFLSKCCKLGPLVCGAHPDIIKSLEDYGFNLGLAFQIHDDLLDYLGEPESLGKPVCSDLRQGIFTLPLIHGLKFGPEKKKIREILEKYLRPAGIDDKKILIILDLLSKNGSFEYTRDKCREFVKKAQDSLKKLPDSKARTCLEQLANFVVSRQN